MAEPSIKENKLNLVFVLNFENLHFYFFAWFLSKQSLSFSNQLRILVMIFVIYYELLWNIPFLQIELISFM